ncbi:MAG: alpha/beta fold hydrolase [Acinetobacter sp.]
MSIKQTVHLIDTKDGCIVSMWQLYKEPENISLKKSIFLSHGTFSDMRVCLGIAKYLAHQGYCCFILEWRGHGKSIKVNKPYNFETVALHDFKAAFDYLSNNMKIDDFHCITHSGGGICLTMLLINYPMYTEKISSITFVACQVFGAASDRLSLFKLILAKYSAKVLGYIPAKHFKLGVIDEKYDIMRQWFDWNIYKNFFSHYYPLDYRQSMPELDIPIYTICGSGDKFIAPVEGCYKFLKAFKNKNNKFQEFGLKYHNLEDYTHSRIILSQNASKEVWPTILQWIKQHSD